MGISEAVRILSDGARHLPYINLIVACRHFGAPAWPSSGCTWVADFAELFSRSGSSKRALPLHKDHLLPFRHVEHRGRKAAAAEQDEPFISPAGVPLHQFCFPAEVLVKVCPD